MAKIRVRTNRLKENMVLGSDVFTPTGAVLVPVGTVVTKDVVHMLTNYFIEQVVIEYDDTKETAVSTSAVPSDVKKMHLQNFTKKFEIAKEDIAHRLEDIVFQDKEIDTDILLNSLNDIIEQSSNSIDLCDMLYRMKSSSDGVYAHCVNIALISQLLGGWMNLNASEIELLGILGLLHDIGKLKLPDSILNKTSPLTKQEVILFERHVIDGYNIVKNKSIDNRIKQAVLTHHERIDGSGYPLRVDGKNIIQLSRILAVADTYDIMTSKQPDRDALCPFDVVASFEQTGHSKFDPCAMMIFLSNILEPFINRNVLLNNGKFARVVFINKANLSRPLVQMDGVFVDLSIRKDLKIMKIVDPSL